MMFLMFFFKFLHFLCKLVASRKVAFGSTSSNFEQLRGTSKAPDPVVFEHLYFTSSNFEQLRVTSSSNECLGMNRLMHIVAQTLLNTHKKCNLSRKNTFVNDFNRKCNKTYVFV